MQENSLIVRSAVLLSPEMIHSKCSVLFSGKMRNIYFEILSVNLEDLENRVVTTSFLTRAIKLYELLFNPFHPL